MTLQLKYRPTVFDDLVGNESTIKAIQSKMKVEIPSSILITGPSGCGKTTLGRIIAHEIGSYDPSLAMNMNFHEYNFALNRGIDVVRDIMKNIYLSPMNAKYRVLLFDECHQITSEGATALLKPLEDAPEHIIFILCTNEPDKLTVTIKRRLFQCAMSLLEEDEIVSYLSEVAHKEKKKVHKDILIAIAERSNGSLGIALRDLDGIIELPVDEMENALHKMEGAQKSIRDLCQLLISKKQVTWKQIIPILNDLQSEEPEKIRRAVMGYCSAILMKGDNPKVGIILNAFVECNTFSIGKISIVNTLYNLIAFLND
jgi:DNA polymerase-3 subunit gamma/tau